MGENPDIQLVLSELRKTKSELQNSASVNAKCLIDKVEDLAKSVHSTNSKMNSLILQVNDHTKRINKIEDKIEEVDAIKLELDNLTDRNRAYQTDNDKLNLSLSSRIEFLEIENRKANIVIAGINETPGEDRAKLARLVNDIFNDVLGINTGFKPHQLYRRGQQKDNQPRRIVVKLYNPMLKIDLLKQGHKLAGSKIYISPDFTPAQEKSRFYLRKFLKDNGNGKGKFISNFVIDIEGSQFKFNELTDKVDQKF